MTIGLAYITIGILYILVCIMDGQDIKPIWKKWVGKKLEKAANCFFPIKYVTETRYLPMPSPTPYERCDYDRLTFDAQRVQSEVMITEDDLMMASRHMPYQYDDIAQRLIAERKRQCRSAIYDMIYAKNAITFEVDSETRFPAIIVRAWMYIGKRR